MEYVTVVKVLRGMNSAFNHGKYTLHYFPYKWTIPLVGKIYAFKDYEHALRWAADYSDVSVWEAEAEIFKEGSCMNCIDLAECYGDFWEWYSSFLKRDVSACPSYLSTAYTPNGTVLCNKLRITSKFKDF